MTDQGDTYTVDENGDVAAGGPQIAWPGLNVYLDTEGRLVASSSRGDIDFFIPGRFKKENVSVILDGQTGILIRIRTTTAVDAETSPGGPDIESIPLETT